MKQDMQKEMVRYGGAELHTVAAVLGGVGAQEITKVPPSSPSDALTHSHC